METKLRELISKSVDKDEKLALKCVLGEIQLMKNRAGAGRITEDQCYSVVKKLIEGNNQVLDKLDKNDPRYNKYINETVFLKQLLPPELTEQQIDVIISLEPDQPEGKMMGSVIKKLKETGFGYNVETVKKLVKKRVSQTPKG